MHATTRGPSKGLDALKANPAPGTLTVRMCDVSSPASVSAWADQLVKDARGPLDLVIHNVGVAKFSNLESTTAEDMVDVFRVNCVGAVLTTQALLKTGAIGHAAHPATAAFLTSKMGSMDDNTSGGSYVYRASKAALNAVVKSLSIDLAPRGVTATLLHPGWVATDMTGNNGLIDTETSAAGLLSVLEDGATWKMDLKGAFTDYKKEAIKW